MQTPPPPIPKQPWSDFGYTANPFRRLFDQDLFASLLENNAPADPAPAKAWIDLAQPVLQLIGEEGYGKSTRLHACHWLIKEEWMQPAIFTYVPLGTCSVSPPTLKPGGFWLLDEAQRLNRWNRRKIAQWVKHSSCNLLLGTHQDLSPSFLRKGVPCHTIPLAPPDAQQLSAFIAKRLSHTSPSLRPARRTLTVPEDTILIIASAMRENLGRAEFILYEACQQAITQENPQSPRLVIHRDWAEQAILRANTVLGSAAPTLHNNPAQANHTVSRGRPEGPKTTPRPPDPAQTPDQSPHAPSTEPSSDAPHT